MLGGDLAVSHLVEAGHQQIAFVGGPMSVRQVSDRRDGAVRALERAGRSDADLLVIETPALNVTAGQWAGAHLAALSAGAAARHPDRAHRAAGRRRRAVAHRRYPRPPDEGRV